METLETVLAEIVGYLKSGDYKNEEHVRVAIVLRILQALDWDIWNPRECWPEHTPNYNNNNERVDVALFKPPVFSKAALFIEVKTVEKLQQKQGFAEAESQLEKYNLYHLASIAVLTDGSQWYFYLPSAEGRFKQKRFMKIDLLTADVSRIKTDFCTFLSKDSLLSGAYKTPAESLIEHIEKQQMMEKVFPEAQKYVLQKGNITLAESLVECCKKHGFSITVKEATEFISEINNGEPPPPPPKPVTSGGSVPPISRHERMPVTVDGYGTFGSTYKAFEALGLPIKPDCIHEKFRKKLRDTGRETFQYEGRNYVFTLSSKRMRLRHPRMGVDATAILHPDGKMTILKGSFAAKIKETGALKKFHPNLAEEHEELLNKGVLIPKKHNEKDVFEFAQDRTFNSKSAAQIILSGRAIGGPSAWKEETPQ
ncbi:MAG: hypothetical protein LBU76_00950 [Azoarcus sp.]|jgi:predicted type IV restriction endonuclease|nr:hypothetical protein [Azoarcus sp.]